jgi:predicted Zn-dependent protease with MMP-like domain
MTDECFKQYVEEGIVSLPEWVHGELKNVAFLIEDEPNAQQREENELQEGEVLFGLYEGVPLSERGNDSPLLPDIITVFKKPILETYTHGEDIRACVHNTIWHEVAHYFGHDEGWVEREEVSRGKLT